MKKIKSFYAEDSIWTAFQFNCHILGVKQTAKINEIIRDWNIQQKAAVNEIILKGREQ